MLQLYRLGTVAWTDSHLFYHTLPRLGRQGIVLCRPDSAHLCLGYHTPAAEVDWEYCRRENLPVIRREVGGGLVYLDSNQVFYQVVVAPSSPLTRGRREDFYRRLLEPAKLALAELGLRGEVRAPCDLWVGGRKISGNGAGEIAGHWVFVGNILLDFPPARMAQALDAPDHFREAAGRMMDDHLTSLRRELGRAPAPEAVLEALARGFQAALGPLAEGELNETLQRAKEDVARRLLSPGWLRASRPNPRERKLKIMEGVYLREVAGKAVTSTEDRGDAGDHASQAGETEGFGCVHAPVAGSVAQASPVKPRTVGEGKEQTSSVAQAAMPPRTVADAQSAANGGSRAITEQGGVGTGTNPAGGKRQGEGRACG